MPGVVPEPESTPVAIAEAAEAAGAAAPAGRGHRREVSDPQQLAEAVGRLGLGLPEAGTDAASVWTPGRTPRPVAIRAPSPGAPFGLRASLSQVPPAGGEVNFTPPLYIPLVFLLYIDICRRAWW